MLRSLTLNLGLWILLGMLSFPHVSWSQAAQGTSETPSLGNRDALEFALLDHPKILIPDLLRRLENHTLVEPSIEWMRAIWLLAQQNELQQAETIKRAAQFAWEQNLLIEWADLMLAQLRLQQDALPLQEAVKRYDEIVAKAREVGDPVVIASCLSRQATFLLDHNQVQEAMVLSLEAKQLVADQKNASLRQVNIIRDAFALTLVGQDHWDSALETYKIMEQDYRAHGVRAARAEVLYNIGFYYLEGTRISSHALDYLNQSLQLAMEIEDLDTTAASYYGLSIYYNRIGRTENAISLAHKALQAYQEMGNKVWVSYSAVRLAEAYLDNKDYQKSLEAVELAAQNFSDGNLEGQIKLERLRQLAYKGLGDIAKAYEHLELYTEKMHTLQEGKLKEEYSKAAAKIGLKFEEDRNEALEKQNELQREQIRLLLNFRIVSVVAVLLTVLVLIALLHVRSQAAVIRRSRQTMKDVLDNIDEALLIIDHNLNIAFGYSSYVERIFGTGKADIHMKPFLQLLFPDDRDQNEMAIMIRDSLMMCIGEGDLSWEVNQDHLPSEIVRQGRIFLIQWQPLFDEQKIISRFLISMRDITEYRQLQKEVAAEKQRIGSLQMKLEEMLACDMGTMDRFIQKLKEEKAGVEAQLEGGDYKEAFRVLHTWKGAARTLGLKQIATAIHRVESCLPSASRPEVDGSGLNHHWQEFQTELMGYQELMEPILSRASSASSRARDLYAYASIYAREMKSRLQASQLACCGLSILDEIVDWAPEVLDVVHEVILLGISNSLDHGFLRPHRQGKTLPPAHIKVWAYSAESSIHLSLTDNGAGIDWEALRRKALELSLTLPDGADVSSLLFQDGLSSATDMSESSGRGVGLSAIRSLSERLGGSVRLESISSGGTGLFLKFPQSSTAGVHRPAHP